MIEVGAARLARYVQDTTFGRESQPPNGLPGPGVSAARRVASISAAWQSSQAEGETDRRTRPVSISTVVEQQQLWATIPFVTKVSSSATSMSKTGPSYLPNAIAFGILGP